MGKVEEKVACQYCGKEYSKAGIANHEKSCAENPANKKPEETPEVLEVDTEKVENTEEVVAESETVEVCMKDSIECYIGDRYYRLRANEVYQVPAHVKDILMRAGMLKAI